VKSTAFGFGTAHPRIRLAQGDSPSWAKPGYEYELRQRPRWRQNANAMRCKGNRKNMCRGTWRFFPTDISGVG